MGTYIPYDENTLEKIAVEVRGKGEILALTGGSFDIGEPHQVHVSFLRKCKGLCGRLFVNVVNDGRVKLYKKDSPIIRPIFAEEARAANVSSIDAVDYVTIHPYIGDPYDEEDIGPTERLALIIRPDVIIKGKDSWTRKRKKRVKDFLGYNIKFGEIRMDESMSSTSLLEYIGRLSLISQI